MLSPLTPVLQTGYTTVMTRLIWSKMHTFFNYPQIKNVSTQKQAQAHMSVTVENSV